MFSGFCSPSPPSNFNPRVARSACEDGDEDLDVDDDDENVDNVDDDGGDNDNDDDCHLKGWVRVGKHSEGCFTVSWGLLQVDDHLHQ